MISLKRTTVTDPAFVELVSMLDKDLWSRYPDKQGIFAPNNKLDERVQVVVAISEGEPVACGGFRPTTSSTEIEVKRMFVHPAFRGKGISRMILQELERWASEQHYTSAILETGIKQPEAIRLYETSGFTRIPNYGPYQDIEESVCMRKLFAS